MPARCLRDSDLYSEEAKQALKTTVSLQKLDLLKLYHVNAGADVVRARGMPNFDPDGLVMLATHVNNRHHGRTATV